MREIKFRVWSESTGEFLDDEYWTVSGCGCIQNFIEEDDCDESLILSQFTGLLDSDGKEIYEDDIILFDRRSHESYKELDVKGVVVFSEFEYIVEVEDSHWPANSWKCVESCKVIGNIHENKNLLNDNT